MPLYEYQCQKCQKVFEVLVRSDKDSKGLACPHCKDKKVRKMFSTFGTNSDQRIASPVPCASAKSGMPAGHAGCTSCASGSCSMGK
ncbi:MAG TPA: zinc ribbon domain-containing protein [Planctomycetota bacterium]|nr:zinc ribbon domain-containing protein [Planctomycetota bacterium]